MVTQLDGEFWFVSFEAAGLMEMSRRRLADLAARGKIRVIESPEGPEFDLYAESDVTIYRRRLREKRLKRQPVKARAKPEPGPKSARRGGRMSDLEARLRNQLEMHLPAGDGGPPGRRRT
jgi:hypothetical protein